MTVTPGLTLTQGQPASVNLNIVNNSSSTFTGTFQVALYNLDSLGTLVQSIGTYKENSGLPSGYTYQSPFLTLNTSSVSASPGTYLLAATFVPSGGSMEIVGSTATFLNPIKVVVQAAKLQPDKFESNNSIANASDLSIGSTTSSILTTTGSNIDNGADVDFYKIKLPDGADYSISVQLNDVNLSKNGKNYSLNGMYSYSLNSTTWSDAFSSSSSTNTITVKGGSSVYFVIAPFFVGQTGTYEFDITVTRTSITEVNMPVLAGNLHIYPNPASEFFIVDTSSLNRAVSSLVIFNNLGHQVKNVSLGSQEIQEVPIGDLPGGVYIVKVLTVDGETFSQKFVIIR
jgi:hypothetical protein